jgi:hypothetical protein
MRGANPNFELLVCDSEIYSEPGCKKDGPIAGTMLPKFSQVACP